MSRGGWLLAGVASSCFAAGVAVGLAIPAAVSELREELPEGPDRAWVRDYLSNFEQRFDLSAAQKRDLRAILLHYVHQEASIRRSADLEQWPPELQTQLVQARRRMEKRIEWILDPAQRALFRGRASSH